MSNLLPCSHLKGECSLYFLLNGYVERDNKEATTSSLHLDVSGQDWGIHLIARQVALTLGISSINIY